MLDIFSIKNAFWAGRGILDSLHGGSTRPSTKFVVLSLWVGSGLHLFFFGSGRDSAWVLHFGI